MRSARLSFGLLLVSLVGFGVAVGTARADLFVQVAGERGEATARGFEGWIQAQSFSYGVSQSGVSASARAGGGGAGKATLTDLTITKLVDRTSPVLFTAAATGKRYPTVALHVTTGGDRGQTAFYRILLSDVLVSSVQVSGSGSDRPSESVSFNFAKIEIEYVVTSEKGDKSQPIKGGFDAKQNKGL